MNVRHLLGPLKTRGIRPNQTEYLIPRFNLKAIFIGFSSVLAALNVLMSTYAAPCQSLSFEETLAKMMDIAGVEPGMIIGEIGSGGGPFTFRLAERVGKNGKIYANDIDQKALDSINEKNIRNIETVLGETDDPAFPVRNLDMVIMRSVFHDLENPLSMLENIKTYLKHEAPLVVIEQLPFDDWPYHVMTKEQLLGIVEQSSFTLVQIDSSLPSRWLVYVLAVDQTKEKRVWINWLNEFRERVNEVKEIEQTQKISPGKVRIAWLRVFDSYRDNDPHSEEDEELREFVNKRIESLERRQKQSTRTAEDVPDTLRSKDVFAFHLRSEYKSVAVDEIIEILGRLGFQGRRTAESGDFPNQYEQMSIDETHVVVDHASGLMWLQAGSGEPLGYFEALAWIDDLNIRKHAGCSDWRLPTVEEVISLFETRKTDEKLRIDSIFSSVQSSIWTGDVPYPGRIWIAIFRGPGLWEELNSNIAWVRPVRSMPINR